MTQAGEGRGQAWLKLLCDMPHDCLYVGVVSWPVWEHRQPGRPAPIKMFSPTPCLSSLVCMSFPEQCLRVLSLSVPDNPLPQVLLCWALKATLFGRGGAFHGAGGFGEGSRVGRHTREKRITEASQGMERTIGQLFNFEFAGISSLPPFSSSSLGVPSQPVYLQKALSKSRGRTKCQKHFKEMLHKGSPVADYLLATRRTPGAVTLQEEVWRNYSCATESVGQDGNSQVVLEDCRSQMTCMAT